MTPVITYGIKEEGKPFWLNLDAVFWRTVNDLLPGEYIVEIRRRYRKATNPQFGYLYAVVYKEMLKALNFAGYDDIVDIDDVDMWCKVMWANKKITDRDSGQIVTLPLSKSEFLTIDQTIYIKKICEHASEYLNWYIPEADKNWRNRR